MNKNKDYLITEKPSQALFAFALPMIIGNLFQQAYTIVDSAIVGHYVGETALAAVGASYALTSIFICVAIGGGIGASVIISQHFGGHAYSPHENQYPYRHAFLPAHQSDAWRHWPVLQQTDHGSLKHPGRCHGHCCNLL
ncbi:MAG: MATE family efflux transporter [Clostridium sp.]